MKVLKNKQSLLVINTESLWFKKICVAKQPLSAFAVKPSPLHINPYNWLSLCVSQNQVRSS